jgi:hypothetical protein
VLKRIDALARLLNLPANNLRNQLRRQLRQRAAARLPLHNLRHLLPDLPNLRAGRICGLLDLVRPALCEGNAEESEQVVVGRLDHHVRLNQRLPLADQRAQLVRCEVEAVEVGEAVLALHFVDAELNFAEGVVFVFLEVGEGDFEDAALESIVGVLETGRSVYEGFADTFA